MDLEKDCALLPSEKCEFLPAATPARRVNGFIRLTSAAWKPVGRAATKMSCETAREHVGKE